MSDLAGDTPQRLDRQNSFPENGSKQDVGIQHQTFPLIIFYRYGANA